MQPESAKPLTRGSILRKLLGVLWAAAAAYLFYGIYGDWIMAKMYPDGAAGFYRLSVFFGITGVLSLVVAVGMYRPSKLTWFLALGLCVALGWYWLKPLLSTAVGAIIGQYAVGPALHSALVPAAHMTLYGVTAVYLLAKSRLFFSGAAIKMEPHP